jgi:hypothetical protein
VPAQSRKRAHACAGHCAASLEVMVGCRWMKSEAGPIVHDMF